jgi:phosphoribosylaminoimidazolecarboxamide formyltransferase/IMP cyclohydrolase
LEVRAVSRALLAPFDKTGIETFARALAQRGVALLATAGTARALRQAGLAVTEVSEHTGFPEMLGGRVKTLHPRIHAGILARRDDPEHMAEMAAHDILPIDLVCLSLYPFGDTVRRPGATLADAVEMIDIGGPAMLRAAAKNHAHVVPLVDAADHGGFLERLDAGRLDADYRRALAAKAYRHTALYDAAVAGYLSAGAAEPFPPFLMLAADRVNELRYGENPHQRGFLYRTPGAQGLAAAEQLNGKELSYINLLDAAGACATVADFDEPTAVVVKHCNPCGAASADDLEDALSSRSTARSAGGSASASRGRASSRSSWRRRSPRRRARRSRRGPSGGRTCGCSSARSRNAPGPRSAPSRAATSSRSATGRRPGRPI